MRDKTQIVENEHKKCNRTEFFLTRSTFCLSGSKDHFVYCRLLVRTTTSALFCCFYLYLCTVTYIIDCELK